MNKKLRIAIIHDAFLYRWGGERLVTLMAKALDADLISGFFSEGSFDPRELGFTGKMIALGNPVFAKGLRHMILKWRFFWKANILSEYDIVIFSGDCLGALKHMKTGAKKVYYCHTPPRYLYDFREKYLASLSILIRPIFQIAFDYFAQVYEKHLEKFDMIFTNSQNTHDRLLHFCEKESTILYPPTDTTRFIPGEKWDGYYLSFARLSPPKRVDMIVDAFLKMPEKKLIFTFGKNDPQKADIISKIQNAPNIRAMEAPEEERLIWLIQWAIATIYIPIDEDFGMSPIESMACWVPVIGVDDGGLRETIVHEKTWLLLPKFITRDDIVEGVNKMTPDVAMSLWEDALLRAEQFSLLSFTCHLKKHLNL